MRRPDRPRRCPKCNAPLLLTPEDRLVNDRPGRPTHRWRHHCFGTVFSLRSRSHLP